MRGPYQDQSTFLTRASRAITKLEDETKLEKVFAILNKNQPVVVYTNTGVKGSVVWFALELLGYDAKLYSYENWLNNQAVVENATA